MKTVSPRTSALTEVSVAVVLTTGCVFLASKFVPDSYVAAAVGAVFLAATWLLVWRKDDEVVIRSGLALGGLVLRDRGLGDVVRAGLTAWAWAGLAALVTFVPFVWGWRFYWNAHGTFALSVRPLEVLNEALGQLLMIALPEEAFYRGYLQSRLDGLWPPRVRVLGADLGPAIVVTSLVFALGHLLTIPQPARLAVFFPSLAFGWLRARTGGVGASMAFHASCNLLSEALGRGYGLY